MQKGITKWCIRTMIFGNLVKNAVGKALKGISDRLLGETTPENVPEPVTRSHIPTPSQVAPPDREYQPREHKAFYAVSLGVIRTLESDPAPKTPRDLSNATGYAESSIRQFCKDLTDDGILIRVSDYPASYVLADSVRAMEFALLCQDRVGPYTPPAPAEEAPKETA